MSMQRKALADPLQHDRLRKRGTVQASLDNEETLYFVNATIGTPPQSLRLTLDTGSSDLWVNTPSSELCQTKSDPCAFAGTYTANSSSTYEYVGSWFNITYVDGSGSSGDYVSDNITIDGSTLDRLQFGIGYTSSSSQGILGIGYPVNEVQVGRAGLAAYKNLPAQMQADGLIQTSAYSLWLNDLDANTGSVLFGGVDTEQFSGTLHTLPIQKQAGVYSEFLITLTALSLGSTTVADGQALAVLLDSGSSLTYLPDDMVDTLYTKLSAQYDESEGAAYVPCSLQDEATNLTFTFSGPSIAVGMDELVLDLYTSTGQRPRFQDGTEACLLGVAPAGSGTSVLGDTFLRSAYVVYDLANNEISLAQTRFNATGTRVLEIASGASGVPDATGVADAAAATAGVQTGSAAESSSSSSGGGAAAGSLGAENGAAPAPGPLAAAALAALAAFSAGCLALL